MSPEREGRYRLGLLGLGVMGSALARNLIRHEIPTALSYRVLQIKPLFRLHFAQKKRKHGVSSTFTFFQIFSALFCAELTKFCQTSII